MGTCGFEVLFSIQGFERIIVVDAVLESEEHIGTIYKLPLEEVIQELVEDPLLFLHGMTWSQGLNYAKKILGDAFPKNISVYLIGINNTSFVETMHPKVKASCETVVQTILKELET